MARPRHSEAQRRYTAIHEAAHAVIRHRICRRPFNRVAIYDTEDDPRQPIPGTLGGLEVTPTVIFGKENAANSVIETLAGPIAEARLRKVSLATIALSTGWHDYTSASEVIERLKEAGWAGAGELEIKTAPRAVTQYWPEIVTVADALKARGSLDYDEFLAVIATK